MGVILFLAALHIGFIFLLGWLAVITFPYGLIAFFLLILYTCRKESKELNLNSTKEIQDGKKNKS